MTYFIWCIVDLMDNTQRKTSFFCIGIPLPQDFTSCAHAAAISCMGVLYVLAMPQKTGANATPVLSSAIPNTVEASMGSGLPLC